MSSGECEPCGGCKRCAENYGSITRDELGAIVRKHVGKAVDELAKRRKSYARRSRPLSKADAFDAMCECEAILDAVNALRTELCELSQRKFTEESAP